MDSPDGVYLPALPPAPASVPIDDWIDRGETTPSPPWRAVAAWASDVYFGVCFWTVFTALGFQLFYWSVWKLGESKVVPMFTKGIILIVSAVGLGARSFSQPLALLDAFQLNTNSGDLAPRSAVSSSGDHRSRHGMLLYPDRGCPSALRVARHSSWVAGSRWELCKAARRPASQVGGSE